MIALIALLAASASASDPMAAGCDLTDAKFVERYNEAAAAMATNPRETVALADKLVADQPGCAGARYLTGAARVLLGDPAAVDLLTAGEKAHPTLASFPTMLSSALFATQDFQGALAAAQRGRKLDPKSRDAAEAVYAALLRLGDYDDLEALIDVFPGIDNGAKDCLRADIRVDQGQNAERLRTSCSGSSDADFRAQGLAALDQARGDHDTAAGHLAAMGAPAAGAEGQVASLIGAGRCAEALPLIREAVAAESWNATHHIRLGGCLLATGDRDGSKQALTHVFGMQTWVMVHESGAMTGVVTKGAEEAFDAALQLALAQLVAIYVEEGDLAGATDAQARAIARYGEVGPLIGAAIRIDAARSGPSGRWGAVQRGIAAHPTDRAPLEVAGDLAFVDARGLPQAVIDAVVARGDDVARYNVLAGLANARSDAACGSLAVALLPVIGADLRPEVAGIGHACAIHGRDLETAAALVKAAPGAWSPAGRVGHADLLLQAGRPAEALAALPAKPDPGFEAATASIKVQALLDLDKLDEARQALTPQVQPELRVNVAIGLYNADRRDEARTVLKDVVCDTLKNGAASCTSLSEALAAP